MADVITYDWDNTPTKLRFEELQKIVSSLEGHSAFKNTSMRFDDLEYLASKLYRESIYINHLVEEIFFSYLDITVTKKKLIKMIFKEHDTLITKRDLDDAIKYLVESDKLSIYSNKKGARYVYHIWFDIF